MGHDKLRKFAQNETFRCLVQPKAEDILGKGGYFNMTDQSIKGHWNAFFAREGKEEIVLELGCGKGEYTIGMARRFPGRLFVGVDIKGARLWRGAKTVTEEGIPNAAFLRTRVEFLPALFAPSEVGAIYLTFSDPQYKSPNSRLTSPVLLESYSRYLSPGGLIHLKTDSTLLFQYTKAVCACNSLETVECCDDVYGPQGQSLAPEIREVRTFYESMFLEQGYKIKYLCFRLGEGGKQLLCPSDFDEEYWRSVEGPRLLFGHDSAETKRQALKNSQEK